VIEKLSAGAMRRKASPPPDSSGLEVRKLMIASEGREIAYPVIVLALELARPLHAQVFVMSIARVWGTGLGFPNPWLNPTKREWDEQKLIVRGAVERMEKAGFDASGVVLATRRGARRITKEAELRGMDAIVMGCDPKRRMMGDFIWSQEPYRVERRAKMPVYLVPVG
jgi:nucleotide-binding universal stress UspA family protein